MSRERVAIKDGRKPGWHWADNEIIKSYGSLLGPYGLALYYALCRHADKDTGECWPSYATLAKETGMSRRRAIEVMKRLVKLELVSKAPREDDAGDATSNLYTLLDLNGGGEPRALGSAPDALQVGNEVHQGSAPRAPKQDSSNNTHLNKKEILLEKKARVHEKDELGRYIDRGPRVKCPECGQYLRGCICEKEDNT